MQKTYRLRERLHENLLEHILLARGVGEEEFGSFLEPSYELGSHDPYLLPGMEAAVERILTALLGNERICVWSDYDADGVPAGVMLTDFLRALGGTVRHYIPDRHKEGYGLNERGLAELTASGTTLVITADLGTTEVEHIAYAKARGVDVIVTDHHLEPEVLPDALAIINPKLSSSRYPFDGLCGAGVAWKLLQAILVKVRSGRYGLAFEQGREKWYLDLVGIATLSDMVPLVGENRMLAHFGLKVLRRGRRPGLAALLSELRIKPGALTEDDIGFMISPRLNAASRMGSPAVAARLLAATSAAEAAEMARILQGLNDERKLLVARIVKEANKRLREQDSDEPVIVLGSPSWRPGVLGLVANKLAEAKGKPALVWGREGGEEDLLRGSARGAGGVNVVELMRTAQGADGLFEHMGGHAASGGFAISPERVHELPARLAEAHRSLAPAAAPEDEMLDRELGLADVEHAGRTLEKLSPFGTGFAKPLFLFPNASVTSVRMFGKQGDHMEIALARDGARVSGVSFFAAPDSFSKKVSAGERADIVGHIERDWRGAPRIRVVDIL